MSNYILAVDIGTSSVRAIVFSDAGAVESLHQEHYGVDTPRPGWQEQDPEQIALKVIRAIKLCLDKTRVYQNDILGMSFSSQMYSIFPIDSQGVPIMKSIIWADSRSDEQVESLRANYGSEFFYERTACPLDSLYPLSKLLWMKETYPDLYQKAYKFISIKEYLLHKLTGEYIVDYSCASATGLFDIAAHVWDERILNVLGIDAGKLSTPQNVTTQVRLNNTELATELNLPVGFPIIIGAGDGPLANIGSGAVGPGEINIDLGTSGAARVIVDRPVFDRESRLWCYCLTNDKWAVGGILSNVGNVYQWIANKVAFHGQPATDEHFAVLNNYAENSKPGANGLYFLPFLLQARSPYWDNRLKGLFYGLNITHTIEDMTRAVIEGVGYSLMSIVEALGENATHGHKLVLTGGIAKAKVWAQILADMLGERLWLPSTQEGSASGAAILGFYALKALNELQFLRPQSYIHYEPDQANHQLYSRLYKSYQRLCQGVRAFDGI